MNPSALVSIIIPTYQSESYLPLLFKSLKNQTYTNWEALFVDNSSTDKTFSMLLEFEQQDSRIKVFKKPHESNPTPSRNLGLLKANGSFVAFCDSDDLWHPQKLEFQVHALENNPALALVCTDRMLFYKRDGEEFKSESLYKEASLEIKTKFRFLYIKNSITHSSTLTRMPLLKKVGFFEPSLVGVDDYHLYLKLSSQGLVGLISLPLTYYYLHPHNLSKNKKLMAQNLWKLFKHSAKDPYIATIAKPLLGFQSVKSLVKVYFF